MKRLVLFSLFIILACALGAEERTEKLAGVISLTSGFPFSGAKAGIGRVDIYDSFAIEYTLNYKQDFAPTFNPSLYENSPLHNIYLQRNRFYNSQGVKSFFILKAGVMWFEMGDWFGGTKRKNTTTLPLASIGYGYSFKLKENIFIRPSLDIGLQTNLVNFELSCGF